MRRSVLLLGVVALAVASSCFGVSGRGAVVGAVGEWGWSVGDPGVVAGAQGSLRPTRTLTISCAGVDSARGGETFFADCQGSRVRTWSGLTGKRGVFIGPLFDEDSGDQFGGPLVIGSYGVAWVDSYDGNYPSWRQVRFAPRTSRRVVALSKEESSRAAVDSDLNLVGGWSFAVFNTWVNGKPRLWRIDGRGAVLIRQDANAGTPLDVDDSRVLLKRGDGALVLLRKDGSLLRVFARIGRGIAPDRWPSAGGVLDGPRIVLDTAREIRVYGASSGTLLRHWRRAPGDPYALFGSYLEDADAGFALYYTCDANDNTTLHLLRLRDGMELVQPVRGKDDAGLCGGSVNARFTSAGLFYSETSPDQVAFVPMPSIRAARFLPIGSSG